MKKIITRITAAAGLALAGIAAQGATHDAAPEQGYATPAQAEQLVARVVGALRKDGVKTQAAITAKDPAWVQGDLYPVVYDLRGKVLAHGQNARMVGKELLAIRDAEGKPFIRERMDLAASKTSFWQDYAFVDPITKNILPKRMYCERADDTVVCAGIYKRH